jgi:hypothetical protein
MNLQHEQMMAVVIHLVIDAKTTGIVLHALPVLSSAAHPFRILARQGTEKFCSFLKCIRVSIRNISDFFTEILVFHS